MGALAAISAVIAIANEDSSQRMNAVKSTIVAFGLGTANTVTSGLSAALKNGGTVNPSVAITFIGTAAAGGATLAGGLAVMDLVLCVKEESPARKVSAIRFFIVAATLGSASAIVKVVTGA